MEASTKEGEASFGFLKYSLSPRSIALGGAGAALVDGIADADLNPAAAARDSGGIALGQGYPTAFSATGNYASWNIPWKSRRITVQARYLGFDNISGWDDLDASTTAYNAHTLKLQAGTAGKFKGIAYGVSVAYAQNNVADATYDAWLFNLGMQRDLIAGFAIGASVLNADIWTSDARNGDKIIPPVTFQGGVSYSRSLPYHTRMAVAVDARKRNDEETVFPVGLEGTWADAISARVGYPFGEPEASPAFGVGLRWSHFGFDYEYQGNTVLTGAHFWALSVKY